MRSERGGGEYWWLVVVVVVKVAMVVAVVIVVTVADAGVNSSCNSDRRGGVESGDDLSKCRWQLTMMMMVMMMMMTMCIPYSALV